jgi:hypothetical protein
LDIYYEAPFIHSLHRRYSVKIAFAFASLTGLALIGTTLAAGPVIQSSNLTPIGTKYQAQNLTSTAKIDPGSAGENQTWNFSTLAVSQTGIPIEVIDPATVPTDIAAYVPTANRWEKNSTGSKTGSYNAYLVSGTECALLALGVYENSDLVINYLAVYNPPLAQIYFPTTYGNTYTDSVKVSSGPVVHATATYDGYGTLVTPFGTYTNVLRARSVSDNGHIVYGWCTSNPYLSILTITDSIRVSINNLEPSSVLTPKAMHLAGIAKAMVPMAGTFDLLGRLQKTVLSAGSNAFIFNGRNGAVLLTKMKNGR